MWLSDQNVGTIYAGLRRGNVWVIEMTECEQIEMRGYTDDEWVRAYI